MRLISHNFAQDPLTTITYSSQNNNFPASNIFHEHRSKQWRSVGNSNQWVVFDLKTTEPINTVVLLWPKGAYKLSTLAVIKIQASATSNFTTPIVDQTISFNHKYEIASHYFESAMNFRYWRILIDDPTNIYGYVSLGVVILGMSEALDHPSNGFSFSSADTSNITRTDFGQSYVDIYPIISSLNLNFEVMEYEVAKNFIDLFLAVGVRKPAFIVIDENSLVFDKDIFCIYGRFEPSYATNHIAYNLFRGSLTITESN